MEPDYQIYFGYAAFMWGIVMASMGEKKLIF